MGEIRAGDVVMIDVVAGAVAGARVAHAKGLFEGDWHPIEVGAFGGGPGPGERGGKEIFREENRIFDGLIWVGRARFLDDVSASVDFVEPGAAVPMIVAREVKNARTLNVERNIVGIGKLIEEVAGISAFVAAASIVSAAHVSARTDALDRPTFPLAVSVEADGDDGRFGAEPDAN